MSDFGWIPVEERPPKDFEEVIVTWVNTNIEQYDSDSGIKKDTTFSGAAVFYKNNWYWYSNVTLYVLMTRGEYKDMLMDSTLKITAWMPLPEPYMEGREDEAADD